MGVSIADGAFNRRSGVTAIAGVDPFTVVRLVLLGVLQNAHGNHRNGVAQRFGNNVGADPWIALKIAVGVV